MSTSVDRSLEFLEGWKPRVESSSRGPTEETSMDEDGLTVGQRKALHDLRQIEEITGFDLTKVLGDPAGADWYSADIQDSTEMLVRGYIVTEYVLLDQFMDQFMMRFFLAQDPANVDVDVVNDEDLEDVARRWRVMLFDQFVLQRIYLLDKYRIFKELFKPPTWVNEFIQATNDLRNGVGHTFAIERRRSELQYKEHSVFSVDALRDFASEGARVHEFLIPKIGELDPEPPTTT
jgi:hypothetical protein